MDSVVAAARWRNSQDEQRYQAYHGKTTQLPIGNPRQRLELLESCDLIYSEFLFRSRWYLYLGIYDIDIKDTRNYAIRAASLAGKTQDLLRILEPELMIIRETLQVPYCVFASGSKGIHVYTKDPDAFICAPDAAKFTPGAIQAYFKNRFSSEFNSILDFSFYSHNKGIRPYSCAHPNTKVVPFVLFASDNWYDGSSEEDDFLFWIEEFIRSYGEQTSTDVETLVVEAATRTTIQNPTPRISAATVTRTRTLCQETNCMLAENQSMDDWIREHSGGHTKRCESGNRKKRYLYFSNGESVNTWCPLYQGVHGSNCCSWVVFENGTAIASCFDEVCAGKLFVLRPFISKPVTYPESVPESSVSICTNEENESSPYLPVGRVIEELLEKKSIVVTAPMGSGKTAAIAKFIEIHNPKRILVIGTRRQQCKAWNNFFSAHGFVLYDTEEGSLFKTDRLLVCLNSLLRVLSIPDESGICTVEPFDLLVLDEADSLATWLGGCLLENNGAIFECLKLIMKTSTYKICMEGLPTSSLTVMLKQLGFFADFHWLVYSSFRFREVVMCNNTRYYSGCFSDALASGINVFFVSNSKTAITRFRDYAYHLGIAKEQVLAIHGGMSEQERVQGANPDEWTRYRLVLANSSLGPGASFNPSDNPHHFAVVFFLVKVTQGVRPSDIGQLINRVRHPGHNKIIGMVLRKNTNTAQLQTTSRSLYQGRMETIGDYCQTVVNVIGPKRELGKRTAANEQIQRERQRCASLGKPPPSANKIRRLEYHPTIVAIPSFDETTRDLVNIPRRCTFGLRFGSLHLERLSAHVSAEGLFWSSDSEMFLEGLLEILHKSGVGYFTVGQRSKMVDDKDIVLVSHYAYLDQIAKECSSDPTDQLDNDYFLEKARPFLSDQVFASTRKKLASYLVPGMDCSLFRFLGIISSYDSTEDSILEAIERDVSIQFEDTIDPVRAMSGVEFRPKAHPRGAGLTNKDTRGELLTSFHNVLFLMGKRFDPVTKSIVPPEPYSTRTYMDSTPEQKQRFWTEVRVLCKLATRQNTNFAFNCKLGVDAFLKSEVPFRSPADHRTMFGILYRLLAWLGFPTKKVVKGKGRRFVAPNGGKRLSCHFVVFDDDHINMCKALVGLTPQGQKTTISEAIKSYFIIQSDQ